MSVGSNIRKRRFELNMSQQELADSLGYKTRSTIAKIESGENDVSHKKLKRFAEVLDTTVEALVSGVSSTSHTAASVAAPQLISDHTAGKHRNRTVAIILAGGKSVRNQQNIPNQFINILGKPVIVYCLEAYQAHPAIDDIYIVCLKGWEQIVTAYAEQYGISKLRGLIPAASSGILSVKSGIDYIQKRYHSDDIVVLQESNRPMVSVDMISKLLLSCQENGCATISQNTRDRVQFIYKDGKAEYVDRNTLVDLQSPEAYRLSIISIVFQKALQTNHELNESCFTMLVYNMGYSINFIEGPINNIKIVRQEDIAVFEAFVKKQ